MLDLMLIRHAATEFNRQARYQGACDPDLSAEGVSQARALGERLAAQRGGADVVWASDRRRAWRTALLALPGVRVRRDARLRELDFGAFDGHTYADNLALHGESFERWLADPWNVRPPGGETLSELLARVETWLQELPSECSALVFMHAGPIYAILAQALGIPFAEARRIPLDPCRAVRLHGSGRRAVMTRLDCMENRPWH